MQTDNLASTLRKSQGQQELGRGSSPLAQQMQTASNGSRENVDAFSGLRINTTANGGPRQDVMDLDGEADEDEDRSDSPDLGGQGMEDEMLDEDEGEFSDDLSSSPSVPDEDIDFEHVYALHTFVATVDGQATVTKGDSLDLLDDSNSYWWLVRVLNTQGVGYIPAENIETPFERLARLNKHRNIDIAGVTQSDHLHGKGSAAAVASIRPPRHGKAAAAAAAAAASAASAKPPVPLGPKAVNFAAPTYFEHSGNEWSEGDSQEDDYSFDGSEEQHMQQEQGAFSDEDDSELTSDDDGLHDHDESGDATLTTADDQQGLGAQTARAQEVRPLQPRTSQTVQQIQQPQEADSARDSVQQQQLQQQQQQQQERSISPSDSSIQSQMRSVGMSVDDMLREQQPSHRYVPQPAQAPLQVRKPMVSRVDANSLSSSQQSPRTVDSSAFESSAAQGTTRKISLTPEIASGAVNASPNPAALQQQRYVPSASAQQRMMAAQNQKPFGASTAANAEDDDSLEGHSSIMSSSSQQSSPGRLKKHQKAGSQSSNDTSMEDGSNSSPGKRKKSGGMFSGLFSRKGKDKEKDKDKKASSDSGRTSDETLRSATPTQNQPTPSSRLMSPEPPVVKRQAPPSFSSLAPQSKKELDDYLETEAKQQQQIEAQQAMYQQYGIRRGPGEQTNQFVPAKERTSLGPPSPGATQTATAKPRRPGSLIGSPGIPGLEAPELSVLRVFSSESVPVEATFKTVLLKASTSTPELLKQTLQRFRLPLDRVDDFYLTIRDADDDREEELQDTDHPLVAFQDLADAAHKAKLQLPSVKRSSVSSISSVSSNLSMHPAIAKLPMNDFSDDSLVKMYLHCRVHTPRASAIDPQRRVSSGGDVETSSASSVGTATASPAAPASTPHDSVTSTLGTRFAVKLAISSADLPDGYIFDPQSTAIIPKLAVERRASLQGANSAALEPTEGTREKCIYFATGVTVTEVIETALDRFGIVGGVVDGGDDVEDKLAKRRSISRVRYGLAQVDPQGQETRLHPSKRLLDCYAQPPIFKQQPTTREARRRSVEAAQMSAPATDIQSSDPTFYLRCATQRQGHVKRSSSTGSHHLHPSGQQTRPEMQRAEPSEVSVYRTPTDELPPDAPPVQSPTRQEIIAAQRAASRANQNAMISAQKNNGVGGVDITLRDKGTLRSSVIATNTSGSNNRRYSFIDPNGAETDVSDLVEAEWSNSLKGHHARNSEDQRSFSPSAMSSGTTNADSASFKTAESTSPKRSTDDEDAVAALRNTPLSIGGSKATQPVDRDHLQEAMQRNASRQSGHSSNRDSADIDDRIERVLAKVRSTQESRASSRHARTPSASGRGSPFATSPSMRESPAFGRGAFSPSMNASRSHSRQNSMETLNKTERRTHSKQPSVSSMLSEGTASSQYSAGLSNTVNTSATTVSPGISTRDRDLNSRTSQRLVYPSDLGGVDHLWTILSTPYSTASAAAPKEVELQPGAETLFGPDLHAHRQTLTDPEVRHWFDENIGLILDIEQRLDAVLDQLVPSI